MRQSGYSPSLSLWLRLITVLTKPHTANSQVRSTKSTLSLNASTLYQYIVSGSISFPSRGAFHLSLTVLVHYRSPYLFSLGRWSSQIQAGFHVSDPTQEHHRLLYIFRLRGYHSLWPFFPKRSTIYKETTFESYNPHQKWVWAFPVSFATTKGISIDFLSTVTKMFQFAVCPLTFVSLTGLL